MYSQKLKIIHLFYEQLTASDEACLIIAKLKKGRDITKP